MVRRMRGSRHECFRKRREATLTDQSERMGGSMDEELSQRRRPDRGGTPWNSTHGGTVEKTVD
eukprot:8100267-Pyramimonas_sp.AAC.1